MKYKNGKTLVFSVLLCFLLVLSISSIATQTSASVGKWSDPLPTVDGQVSVDDIKRSSHIQISDVNVFSQMGEVIGTCNFSVFIAANISHVYVGVNITNVPFLANTIFGDSGPPTGGNITMVNIRFDNNGNGTIDQNEDQKQVMMFNSTFFIASDDFWNTTADDYSRDVGDDGPNPGNITAYNITHSNMAAQGSIGDLVMEMIFWNGTNIVDPEGRDGGGVISDNTTIAIDFTAFAIDDPSQMYHASTAGIGERTDSSGFEEIIDIGTADLDNFSADADINSTEKTNAEFTKEFPDVNIYGPGGWTTDVDVYVANNATHLYVGVTIDKVPYYANATWNETSGAPEEGVPLNATFVDVKFDNNNNNIIDDYEDAKEVILGNSTLTLGSDRFWDSSGEEHASDSGSEFPPDPGNMTAFAIHHSNTAAQGNVGVLTVELCMLLADDPSGLDGGGLSGTVGFSISYQAFVNLVIPIGGGPPESVDAIYYSEFSGMPEGDNNATLFWDLVIKDSNPAPEIDEPDDVSYEEGSIGNSITWTPTDTNPYKYSVTKDGVVVEEGYWESGEEIEIDVDGLSVGEYTYVCSVNDTGGNSASDEVTVEVTEAVSEFPLMWTVFGVGILIASIKAVLTLKKKKLP